MAKPSESINKHQSEVIAPFVFTLVETAENTDLWEYEHGSENDIEHLFMCLLVLYMSFLEKCLILLQPILKCLGFFFFFLDIELYEFIIYFG